MASLSKEQLGALTRLGAHARLAELVAEMDAVLAAFPDLGALPARQGRSGSSPFAPKRAAKRHRSRMSAAARKAVSERMKRYWAERRKAKSK